MIGGHVIEIRPMVQTDADDPSFRREVVRLWCMDAKSFDEAAVYAAPSDDLPQLGEMIWWHADQIFFNKDRKRLRKIGYSFDPRNG